MRALVSKGRCRSAFEKGSFVGTVREQPKDRNLVGRWNFTTCKEREHGVRRTALEMKCCACHAWDVEAIRNSGGKRSLMTVLCRPAWVRWLLGLKLSRALPWVGS
jgi:hypothetical protein